MDFNLLREIVRKVPWVDSLKDKEAEVAWQFLKGSVLDAQQEHGILTW